MLIDVDPARVQTVEVAGPGFLNVRFAPGYLAAGLRDVLAAGDAYGRTDAHAGETATELAPWVGTCPAGHVAYRHRKATRPTSCAKCAPTFDPRFALSWMRREISPAVRLAASTPR